MIRDVPRWVALVYWVLEFVEYKLINPVGSWLGWTRFELRDKHCTCLRCIERQVVKESRK